MAFTSKEFADYCTVQKIEHSLITTGIPRANGQVERVNRTLIPLLTKLSEPKKEEWFKYLELAQEYMNITLHRSIGMSPFHLLFGTQPRFRENPHIRELIEKEAVTTFQENRDEIREHALQTLAKIQRENKKNYDKRRVNPIVYSADDLVAIKRTQQAPGMKFANKFLGPYRVIKVLRNNRYVVRKVGECEGPQETSTAADYMKPWVNKQNDLTSEEEL